ncbi:MAG: helix-turn-helix transcriptional regulator [Lachnospiraceae bacterium]|nr:helix-turn-helix transcriptional regulator [Lachnospiraceae bacterium]
MEMHAYSFDYVEAAQKNLGDMLDFAVNTCNLDLNNFYQMFLSSRVAEQFGKGNPRYVAGMNGAELTWEVLRAAREKLPRRKPVFYPDKSPEYWCGWSLAWYQWLTARSFRKIQRLIPIEEVLCMYPTHHEADRERFRETMDELFRKRHQQSYLQWYRTLCGLSVQDLSKMSGVEEEKIVRMETDPDLINSVPAQEVWRLATALSCSVEEILEI